MQPNEEILAAAAHYAANFREISESESTVIFAELKLPGLSSEKKDRLMSQAQFIGKLIFRTKTEQIKTRQSVLSQHSRAHFIPHLYLQPSNSNPCSLKLNSNPCSHVHVSLFCLVKMVA